LWILERFLLIIHAENIATRIHRRERRQTIRLESLSPIRDAFYSLRLVIHSNKLTDAPEPCLCVLITNVNAGHPAVIMLHYGVLPSMPTLPIDGQLDELAIDDVGIRARARARLLTTVISVQEEERRRVARELHDGISQTLMSLLLKLRLIENAGTLDESKEIARFLQDIVQSAVRDVRCLARGLHPGILDELGLAAALERYATEFQEVHGIQVVAHFLDIACTRLPSVVETTLYRILQEALNNAVKHAAAKNIRIVIERRHSAVHLSIEDNGRGFDPQALSQGDESTRLGMSTMRERAALLNGTFSVESRPGIGTVINVCIPLEENDHDQDSNSNCG
jgi:signal transduction histidine kinase